VRIYLAGKMDAEGGAWRDALLESPPAGRHATPRRPYWELVRDSAGGDLDLGQLGVQPWPTTPNRSVLGLHEYVGPYRTTYAPEIDSKYAGYFHGSTVTGQHGQSSWDDHPLIVRECWRAIHRADLMFAYITGPDCFGTLAEIGMAKGIGGYVVGVFETDAEWEDSDYWFAGQLCDAVVRTDGPVEVGPEPPPVDWSRWDSDEQRAVIEARDAWDLRRRKEAGRVRGLLTNAILQWSARPEPPAPVELVRTTEDQTARVFYEAAHSFSQIAHWTADPRVRAEAQRMLRRLGA
jgi:hypothetical protein